MGIVLSSSQRVHPLGEASSTIEKNAMRLRLEQTNERLTRRSGLILIDRFGKKIELGKKIDEEFPAPGSNRGFRASMFATASLPR